MACILKAPTTKSKGILIFTTQERDNLILKDFLLQENIIKLKDKWVIGLHHNWHDYNFDYNPLFDFSMAGQGDLIERNKRKYKLVDMDACNFVPDFFKSNHGEKFWDILYVARAVNFKKIPEFFKCVRELYNHKHNFRILFICPIPPYDKENEKTTFYNIRKVYDKLFSEEEKDLFTLLTIDYRYPFPLDLETLAFFYRSSKIFVHFADDEKRCRVAAYAWASGLPVIGMSCIGSLLPEKMRLEPYFYQVDSYSHFPSKIIFCLKQIKTQQKKSNIQTEKLFKDQYTLLTLEKKIRRIFKSMGLFYCEKNMYEHDLGLRLGRHHELGSGQNTVNMKMTTFIEFLLKNQANIAEIIGDSKDPESVILSHSTKRNLLRNVLSF